MLTIFFLNSFYQSFHCRQFPSSNLHSSSPLVEVTVHSSIDTPTLKHRTSRHQISRRRIRQSPINTPKNSCNVVEVTTCTLCYGEPIIGHNFKFLIFVFFIVISDIFKDVTLLACEHFLIPNLFSICVFS